MWRLIPVAPLLVWRFAWHLPELAQKNSRGTHPRYREAMSERIAAWAGLIASILLGGNSAAEGQDYTARFKQLQDQKAAGAQIDSLLDEWRTQKPNDPDAWITS